MNSVEIKIHSNDWPDQISATRRADQSTPPMRFWRGQPGLHSTAATIQFNLACYEAQMGRLDVTEGALAAQHLDAWSCKNANLVAVIGSVGDRAWVHGMISPYGPPKDTQEITALLHAAVDRGVTYFDTAKVHGPFANEELVEPALAPVREQQEMKINAARHSGAKRFACTSRFTEYLSHFRQ
jgi:hypothetical protein